MMNPNPTPHTSVRHRRIGRKVMLADRLHHALEKPRQNRIKATWAFLRSRPRRTAAVCILLIAVLALGAGGVQYYQAKALASQKAAAAIQQQKITAKSLAAEACRQEKAKQKADQLGKITYDQLYDGNECNK